MKAEQVTNMNCASGNDAGGCEEILEDQASKAGDEYCSDSKARLFGLVNP
jgi:hypothetical protein